MTIQQQLKTIGLTKSETAIYLFILENGTSTPPQIAKGTGIARTNAYNVLETLKNKGLIKQQIAGKRKTYVAKDPESLLQTIEQQRTAVQEILPDLRALHTTQKNKPTIRFYEGKEQIKEIYLQTLESDKVQFIGTVKLFGEVLGETFANHYFKKLKEKNIAVYDITSHTSPESESSKLIQGILKGLHEARSITKEYDELKIEIVLWDNNVGIVNLEKPYFGTVITNPQLAASFKAIFQILWDNLQKAST